MAQVMASLIEIETLDDIVELFPQETGKNISFTLDNVKYTGFVGSVWMQINIGPKTVREYNWSKKQQCWIRDLTVT